MALALFIYHFCMHFYLHYNTLLTNRGLNVLNSYKTTVIMQNKYKIDFFITIIKILKVIFYIVYYYFILLF